MLASQFFSVSKQYDRIIFFQCLMKSFQGTLTFRMVRWRFILSNAQLMHDLLKNSRHEFRALIRLNRLREAYKWEKFYQSLNNVLSFNILRLNGVWKTCGSTHYSEKIFIAWLGFRQGTNTVNNYSAERFLKSKYWLSNELLYCLVGFSYHLTSMARFTKLGNVRFQSWPVKLVKNFVVGLIYTKMAGHGRFMFHV